MDPVVARNVARRLHGGQRTRFLTLVELEALGLLTHIDDESYELYVLRIVRAGGAAGRLARAVKLADLEDHLDHAEIPADAPPYAWARRRVALARARDVGAGVHHGSATASPR